MLYNVIVALVISGEIWWLSINKLWLMTLWTVYCCERIQCFASLACSHNLKLLLFFAVNLETETKCSMVIFKKDLLSFPLFGFLGCYVFDYLSECNFQTVSKLPNLKSKPIVTKRVLICHCCFNVLVLMLFIATC